jgi:hypothetical protein
MDFRKTLEEEGEFVARGFFVVYDQCVNRHDSVWACYLASICDDGFAFNLGACD